MRFSKEHDTDVKEGHRAAGVNELRARCGMPPMGAYAGTIPCLKCEKDFYSIDRRSNRICDPCKGKSDWLSGAASRLDSAFPAVEHNHLVDHRRRGEKEPRRTPRVKGRKRLLIQEELAEFLEEPAEVIDLREVSSEWLGTDYD